MLKEVKVLPLARIGIVYATKNTLGILELRADLEVDKYIELTQIPTPRFR
jgi:hypothetical protein